MCNPEPFSFAAAGARQVSRPGSLLNPPRLVLLPPTFPDSLHAAQLVNVTIELEAGIPGSTAGGRFWSPYREAILPYLNLHASAAVIYFLERLAEPRYFRMLHSLVTSSGAELVREELANNTAMLLSHTFDVQSHQPQSKVGDVQLPFSTSPPPIFAVTSSPSLCCN